MKNAPTPVGRTPQRVIPCATPPGERLDIERMKTDGATQKEIIMAAQEVISFPGRRRVSFADTRAILIANNLITPRHRKPVLGGHNQSGQARRVKTDPTETRPRPKRTGSQEHGQG